MRPLTTLVVTSFFIINLGTSFAHETLLFHAHPHEQGQGGILVPQNTDQVFENRDIVLKDAQSRERIRLDAQTGGLFWLNNEENIIGRFDPQSGNLYIGGFGAEGDIVLFPGRVDARDANIVPANAATILLNSQDASAILGDELAGGKIALRGPGRGADGPIQVIRLNSEEGRISVGAEGKEGALVVRDRTGQRQILLDGQRGRVVAGDVVLDGRDTSISMGNVNLDGESGRVSAGQIVSSRLSADQIASDQILGGQILSRHRSALDGGIDNSSVYVESLNPAIGLLDSSNGNVNEWIVDTTNNGTLRFRPGNTTGVADPQFVISSNGNVGLGTQDPAQFKMAVNGTIRAKEIIVESGWSDFVFEDGYHLLSLDEVRNFIRQNGHLPNIPTNTEVKENGIALGVIQSALLRQIEELVLHSISLHERIGRLEAKLQSNLIDMQND